MSKFRIINKLLFCWPRIKADFKLLFGMKSRMDTKDRLLLEDTILPFFSSNSSCARILLIGCDWYTAWYADIFELAEYWTMDPNQKKRKYGARRHVVDYIANISQYIGENYFNLIIMNGVIGFGLNNMAETDRSIRECYRHLGEKGILVIGWNDTAERTPFRLDSCESLSKFNRYHFDPLSSWRYRVEGTDNGHTFDFYEKV